MKKTIVLLLSIVLLIISACGGVKEDSSAPPTSDIDLSFIVGEYKINILDKADGVIDALGEPLDYSEFNSCAYQGKDLYYYYDGFQIGVNEINGEHVVTSISLLDDTVFTPQGVRIGMNVEKALSLIPYTNAGNDELLEYSNTFATLKIHTQNGKISSIDYYAK